MGWGKITKTIIFCCSIFLVFVLIPTNIDSNTSNSTIMYLDCDPEKYAKSDFLNVKNIQTFLKNENFFDGKLNGYLDNNLVIGIKKFQQFVGIRVDGIIGPSTHKAMTSYDKCEKKVKALMIDCGEYLAYRECTFFVKAFYDTLPNEEPEITIDSAPVVEDITHKKDCEDGGKLWHGDTGTLWNAELNFIIYSNCDEFTVAKNTGYDFTVKPTPGVTPGVGGGNSEPPSSGLVINNLSGAVSINENQKAVVNISASGVGSLTYSLSGTDASLMNVDSNGAVTLNSNADYEQKTSYTAIATVADSVSATSKTLSVSVADITEYATVKVVTWYDDNTLSNCIDYISVNGSLECGVNTASKLATQWEDTEVWQNKWFSNSVVNLRVDTVTPQEWTSLTTPQANAIALDSYDPLYVFASNEQVNKYSIRNGIHHSHLLNTWTSANGGQCSALTQRPSDRNMMRHLISRGIIKAFGCFSHELGHSLGLLHAVNQASSPASYASGTYNYGYYDATNNIGTTMSYSGLFCMMYSNPDLKCPTQAERNAAVSAGTYDTSNIVIDKVIDGTWGSIPAGKENEADAARFMNEYLRDYERSYPSTNYGVNVGSDYVSTLSLFPQFDGASASYSYTEGLTNFTSNDTLTMHSELGTNQTENSVTYSNLTWCDVQNCDIVYGNPFAWPEKTGYSAELGFQFYFNQGKLYTKRAKPISQFITNPYANHISYPTPCLQLNKYMRVGEYLETDCISNREDTFGSKTNVDAWNFSNIVEKELVVTPYGDFDAYKIITSHARWDDDDGDYENIDFDYQTLIFWVAPDVGLVMFQDEELRRWKLTAMDTDGDGTDNKTDTDDDNDGVLDTADALPLDPNSSTDNNNDGRADEDE
ncbi:peptidoglycan-binding protein [Candidatus Actinomarina]|nr:peptidoglycan-binding protein [Candidatus Actinomarina sp.]